MTLTEHGMPVAAIIGVDDLADLQDGAEVSEEAGAVYVLNVGLVLRRR